VIPVVRYINPVRCTQERSDLGESHRGPKPNGSLGWLGMLAAGTRFRSPGSGSRQKQQGRGHCPKSWSKRQAHRKFPRLYSHAAAVGGAVSSGVVG
jgi:hypothetical protein